MLRPFSSKLLSLTRPNPAIKLVGSRSLSNDYKSKCEDLSIETKDQVLWIKLNRPKKFNALTKDMYVQLTETFRKVNHDESVKALVLTGSGDYYCSGNDLTNFASALQDPKGPRAGLKVCRDLLEDFVDSVIDIEKLFIAAVNGPAVGISVTILPLCDYVIASSTATFRTPFTALGQCPEACSSLTLPRIVGQSRSTELLLLNMTWDAKKAQEYGFISEVIQADKFENHLENLLYGGHGIVKNCYPNSLRMSKSLVRNSKFRGELKEANKRECDTILDLWCGKESMDALKKFYDRSKN